MSRFNCAAETTVEGKPTPPPSQANTPGRYRNSQYICRILIKFAVLQVKALISAEEAHRATSQPPAASQVKALSLPQQE
jgi:hypothetical protein